MSEETVRALVARVGIDDIVDAVTMVAAPWERWAEQVPALRFVVKNGGDSSREARPMSGPVAWAASRIRKPDIPDDFAARSTESLLSHCSVHGGASKVSDELARRTDPETLRLLATAAESGTSEKRHLALRALGKHGSTEFVAAAEAFLRTESALLPAERREHRLWQGFLALPRGAPADSYAGLRAALVP